LTGTGSFDQLSGKISDTLTRLWLTAIVIKLELDRYIAALTIRADCGTIVTVGTTGNQ